MTKTEASGLTQLGSKVELPESPDVALLERVPSSENNTNILVRFTLPDVFADGFCQRL